MIEFVNGPLLYISIAVFVLGLVLRVVLYICGLDQRLDRVAYKAHMAVGLKGALYSVFVWMIPGYVRGWRTQPLMMLVFFMLHCGAILIPLFLLGHTVMMEYLFGFSLPALPQSAGDVLTVLALIGLAGMALRRVILPEVRVLTTFSDWLILVLTVLPFITGGMARLETANYDTWMFLHLLSAELFLILTPFTKLSHMALYFLSRAQIGMDFAIKRGGEHRGAAFPW